MSGNRDSIGLANGLSSDKRQASIWTKPVSQPRVYYCQWDSLAQNSVKFHAKFTHFLSWKCTWKYRLRNGGHFIQGKWINKRPCMDQSRTYTWRGFGYRVCYGISRYIDDYKFYTLRPTQNGRRFPDDIFKRILLTENIYLSIDISLELVFKGPWSRYHYYSIGSHNGFAPTKQQATVWSNGSLVS